MFDAPAAPDLNLIDPNTEFSSASAYSSPDFGKTPAVSSGTTPTAMYASMGVSAISAITGALLQSSAIRAQGDYQATLSRTNSEIANLQEKQVLEAGDIAASRQNLKTRAVVGALKAQQGASGVDVASGSSALVRSAIQGAGATDELTIRNNAARQAWGYQTESIEDTFKGQFAQLTAKSQANQSLLTGGLSAISEPLTMEANYLRFQRYLGVKGSPEASGMSGSGVPFPNMATGQ